MDNSVPRPPVDTVWPDHYRSDPMIRHTGGSLSRGNGSSMPAPVLSVLGAFAVILSLLMPLQASAQDET